MNGGYARLPEATWRAQRAIFAHFWQGWSVFAENVHRLRRAP
jgi:hypothetical protein